MRVSADTCVSVSLGAFALTSLLFSVRSSHEGQIITLGLVVALISAAIGIVSYLTCALKPRFLKFVSLTLATANIWRGIDAAVNYLTYQWPQFRHWVDSMPFLPR